MACYRIGMRGGHSPNCKGAIGYLDEQKEVRSLYYVLADKLNKSKGYEIINCNSDAYDVYTELKDGTDMANSWMCALYVTLHMNAANWSANGVEVWLHPNASSETIELAKRICRNISALGFQNRGIKYSSNLHDLNSSDMEAMIIEICFCDSEKDSNTYGAYSVANAISDAFSGIETSVPDTSVGWEQDNVGWSYKMENGLYVKSCWKWIQNGWYRFDGSGYMYQSAWFYDEEEDKWYYLNSEGRMITGWACIGGYWYYLNEEKTEENPTGAMVIGWIREGVNRYYMLPENDGQKKGSLAWGWKQIDGEWYYFSTEGNKLLRSGQMVRCQWIPSVSDAAVLYYVKDNGQMAHDEDLNIDGVAYKFGSDGALENQLN